MDWLLTRQERIERGLAKRHLAPGGLVLYDLTSSVVEGRCCPLAKRGYSRDGKPGTRQIEYGLVTDAAGARWRSRWCPAIPPTRPRCPRSSRSCGSASSSPRSCWWGTGACSRVPASRACARRAWAGSARCGPRPSASSPGRHLQLGLFDERGLAEITDPAYPELPAEKAQITLGSPGEAAILWLHGRGREAEQLERAGLQGRGQGELGVGLVVGDATGCDVVLGERREMAQQRGEGAHR